MHEIEIKNLKKLVEVLGLLANEHRLRIIALLAEKPMYISEIKRKLKKMGIIEGDPYTGYRLSERAHELLTAVITTSTTTR